MDVYGGSTSNIFKPIPMGSASQLRFLTIANPRWSTHVQSPAAAWWSVAWTTLLTLPSAEMDWRACDCGWRTSCRCTCWSYDTTGKHHKMWCIMCIWYVGKLQHFTKIWEDSVRPKHLLDPCENIRAHPMIWNHIVIVKQLLRTKNNKKHFDISNRKPYDNICALITCLNLHPLRGGATYRFCWNAWLLRYRWTEWIESTKWSQLETIWNCSSWEQIWCKLEHPSPCCIHSNHDLNTFSQEIMIARQQSPKV